MAAVFYSFSGKDMFKVGATAVASPVSIDVLEGLVGSDNMMILTQIGITTTDTIQYFMAFDDVISHYYFGKGLGSINVQGMIFQDCSSSNFPGLTKLQLALANKRGSTVQISTGAIWFKGVLSETSISFISEPETMINFSVTITMTDHNLPTPTLPDVTC